MKNRPDLILLNETWLKPCIENNQIIDKNLSSSTLSDRSETSHLSDSDNPQKIFEIYAGGVLIAIRSYIKAEFKQLDLHKAAEIKAIEVS